MNTTAQIAPPPRTEFRFPSDEALIAENTATAAANAVGSLVRALAAERPSAPSLRPGGPPVDEVLRVMLRPMIQEWLDHHLPNLVKRQVRMEVRRIVSRAI